MSSYLQHGVAVVPVLENILMKTSDYIDVFDTAVQFFQFYTVLEPNSAQDIYRPIHGPNRT
jgi:hypothetical protein